MHDARNLHDEVVKLGVEWLKDLKSSWGNKIRQNDAKKQRIKARVKKATYVVAGFVAASLFAMWLKYAIDDARQKKHAEWLQIVNQYDKIVERN